MYYFLGVSFFYMIEALNKLSLINDDHIYTIYVIFHFPTSLFPIKIK